jgi:hypothetical protein
MSMEHEESVLSGVDPFAQPRDAEEAWFDEPTSSRRLPVRLTPVPSAPLPIGDREADRWFR